MDQTNSNDRLVLNTVIRLDKLVCGKQGAISQGNDNKTVILNINLSSEQDKESCTLTMQAVVKGQEVLEQEASSRNLFEVEAVGSAVVQAEKLNPEDKQIVASSLFSFLSGRISNLIVDMGYSGVFIPRVLPRSALQQKS